MISGLATVGIVIPPLIGVAADRLGLAPGMWLFVLAPACILVLVLTSRGDGGFADRRRRAGACDGDTGRETSRA